MRTDNLTPGSPEAVDCGCACLRAANEHGAGRVIAGQVFWWVDPGCPVHGTPTGIALRAVFEKKGPVV